MSKELDLAIAKAIQKCFTNGATDYTQFQKHFNTAIAEIKAAILAEIPAKKTERGLNPMVTAVNVGWNKAVTEITEKLK